MHIKWFLLILLLAVNCARAADGTRQDLRQLQKLAEAFLRAQTGGEQQDVTVAVDAPDPRLNLPACTSLQAFLPLVAVASGPTTVGVACRKSVVWTVYLRARIQRRQTYLVSARALRAGDVLGAADIQTRSGELGVLSGLVAMKADQVVGRHVRAALPSGAPLRLDMFVEQPVVLQGQGVELVASGKGFRITSQGLALNNAGEGQPVRIRTEKGQTAKGIAHKGGIVELVY